MINFKNEIAFLHAAEGLKKEIRHCWLSNMRPESVAEHTWRLALMVLRYADKLSVQIDIKKSLAMALIHDLPEAIVGDIPIFKVKNKHEKFLSEKKGMDVLCDKIGDDGKYLMSLWLEYEEQKSFESQFVKALDKLEALLQHNESPLETWSEYEKLMVFQNAWVLNFCEFDPFLQSFAKAISDEAIKKLELGGEDLNAIKAKSLACSP